MSFPYFDLVMRAHDELLSAGLIATRTDQADLEHDKGLLTRRAGFYAYQVDPSIGLLEKTSGNNALGYSVDVLVRRDGTFWDIATDRAGRAMPVNSAASGPDPEMAARWRTPTAGLAQLGDTPPDVPERPPIADRSEAVFYAPVTLTETARVMGTIVPQPDGFVVLITSKGDIISPQEDGRIELRQTVGRWELARRVGPMLLRYDGTGRTFWVELTPRDL